MTSSTTHSNMPPVNQGDNVFGYRYLLEQDLRSDMVAKRCFAKECSEKSTNFLIVEADRLSGSAQRSWLYFCREHIRCYMTYPDCGMGVERVVSAMPSSQRDSRCEFVGCTQVMTLDCSIEFTALRRHAILKLCPSHVPNIRSDPDYSFGQYWRDERALRDFSKHGPSKRSQTEDNQEERPAKMRKVYNLRPRPQKK